MTGSAAGTTAHGRGTHLYIFFFLLDHKPYHTVWSIHNYLFQYNGIQFRRSAGSRQGNYLYFPHFQKCHIENFDSPSELLLCWWIEALKIDLGAQQQAFSWGTLFTLILSVPWVLTFEQTHVVLELKVKCFRSSLSCGRALTLCVGNTGKCLMWQLLALWIFTNHSLLITLMSVWCS